MARRAPFEARFPFRDYAKVERAQRRRLAATVAHAHEHVPYYRETMRRLGLGPGDFRAESDLARLPLIDREQLQRDPDYFLSRAEPREELVELRSGGSSTEPLSMFHHPFSLFEQAVYSERRRAVISLLAGRRRYREARIADLPDSHAGGGHVSRSFRSLSLVSPSIRLNRRDFNFLDPLESLVPRLDEFRPDVISSFGSFHEMLFSHLLAGKAQMRAPRVAVYAGDGMTHSARELLRDRFGVEPLSTYTASEAFQIGFECDRHRGHHLNVDLFPVRIISEEGEDLPDGESGEVVVSNLQARGTVLLNYRLNDVAAKLPGACGCGRSLPLLSLVQGRSDEWLEDSEGRHVHSQAIRILFHDELEVLRFQVTQEARDRFRAAVVLAPGADDEALAERLRGRFASLFGERTRLAVSVVESLPRTAAGKTRPVIAMKRLADLPGE